MRSGSNEMIMFSPNGRLGSLPRSSVTSCPSEIASPVSTSAAACRRFASVMRLAAPIWSSSPQRPQFDSSVIHWSNSARVAPGSLAERSGWLADTHPVRTTDCEDC